MKCTAAVRTIEHSIQIETFHIFGAKNGRCDSAESVIIVIIIIYDSYSY